MTERASQLNFSVFLCKLAAAAVTLPSVTGGLAASVLKYGMDYNIAGRVSQPLPEPFKRSARKTIKRAADVAAATPLGGTGLRLFPSGEPPLGMASASARCPKSLSIASARSVPLGQWSSGTGIPPSTSSGFGTNEGGKYLCIETVQRGRDTTQRSRRQASNLAKGPKNRA